MFFAPFLVSFYVFGCNNFQKMVFKVQPGSPETILGQDLHYTHFQENTVTDWKQSRLFFPPPFHLDFRIHKIEEMQLFLEGDKIWLWSAVNGRNIQIRLVTCFQPRTGLPLRKGECTSAPTILGMWEPIKFPITASGFIVHIWKIILVKQKGVCALCCQYCEGWGDYKAN